MLTIVTYTATLMDKKKKEELFAANWYQQHVRARQLYRKAGLVFAQGTTSIEDELVWLTCKITSRPYRSFPALRNRVPSADQAAAFWRIVRKRTASDIPLAYLLKEAWFAGRCFSVDQRVLIPRSPFAEVFNSHISKIVARPPDSILEIGTGSGCIAITAALTFPLARVVATDISGGALQVAAKNVARYSLKKRIQLCNSDCYKKLPKDSVFDLIVSNPPYIKHKLYQQQARSFAFEPIGALVSAKDDLRVVHTLIRNAATYLSSDGVLIIEVGMREAEVRRQFSLVPFRSVALRHGGSGLLYATKTMLARLNKVK